MKLYRFAHGLSSQILTVFSARDFTTCWDNLIINRHYSKYFFSLCLTRISLPVTFLLLESSDCGLSLAARLHHICPMLNLAGVCQQDRLWLNRYIGLLFGAVRMHSSVSLWPFGSMIAFLFPSVRTEIHLSCVVFFLSLQFLFIRKIQKWRKIKHKSNKVGVLVLRRFTVFLYFVFQASFRNSCVVSRL